MIQFQLRSFCLGLLVSAIALTALNVVLDDIEHERLRKTAAAEHKHVLEEATEACESRISELSGHCIRALIET